jgi:hypothetical protein
MLYYAVYDLETGHILLTHSRVDLEGNHLEVPEAHILSLLDPRHDRAKIGITPVMMPKDARGGFYKIDPRSRKPIFGTSGGGGGLGDQK